MALLEIEELAKERVVLGVGDLRLIEDVVLPRVVLDGAAQLARASAVGLGDGVQDCTGQSVASLTAKIFTPASSNLMTSSSPERVMVLLSTVPSP